MTSLVSGELLKIRTTRSFWWTIGIVELLVVLLTVVQLVNGVGDEQSVRDLLYTLTIVGLFLMIIGIVGSAGEYRHGTITSSLLVAPNRARFHIAKAVAYAITALVIIVLTAILVLAITIPWLSSNGTSISSLGLGGGDLASVLLQVLAYCVIAAVFGVAIGALVTNQVAAIVGILIFMLAIDPILSGLVDTYGKLSLSGIITSLSGGDSGSDVLSAGVAAALFAGYSAVILAAAILASGRRDVSS